MVVEQYAQTHEGNLPASLEQVADAGLPAEFSDSNATITIENGEVVITFSSPAEIAGGSLALVPTAGDGGLMEWQCRNRDLPGNTCPASARNDGGHAARRRWPHGRMPMQHRRLTGRASRVQPVTRDLRQRVPWQSQAADRTLQLQLRRRSSAVRFGGRARLLDPALLRPWRAVPGQPRDRAPHRLAQADGIAPDLHPVDARVPRLLARAGEVRARHRGALAGARLPAVQSGGRDRATPDAGTGRAQRRLGDARGARRDAHGAAGHLPCRRRCAATCARPACGCRTAPRRWVAPTWRRGRSNCSSANWPNCRRIASRPRGRACATASCARGRKTRRRASAFRWATGTRSSSRSACRWVSADGERILAFNCSGPLEVVTRERLLQDLGPRLVALRDQVRAPHRRQVLASPRCRSGFSATRWR